jgi:succinate dehydrogenase / fumarate reductase, cytochrome b subunit
MPYNYHRPTFLNLALIRFPANAVASALHRISGVLLALLIPGLVYLLDLSLQGPGGFAKATGLFSKVGVKVIVGVVLWALLHHTLAGVRFLLLDLHIGMRDYRPSWSARAVSILALLITLLLMGVWW